MDTSQWRFLSGCVTDGAASHLFCAVENIEVSDAGEPNSLFVVLHEGAWLRYGTTPAWSAIAMAATQDARDGSALVLALGPAGDVFELHPKGPRESIAVVRPTPGFVNLLADQNAVFACGMGRVCFVREPSGEWTDISAPWPDAREGVIGFTALTGGGAHRLHAVGWQGEIWTRHAGRWDREDSPTNANLNAACRTPDGIVLCVGDGGALIRGNAGQWSLVDLGTDIDLMDVCTHRGQLFVCSNSAVYRIEDEALVPDFEGDGDDVPRTGLKLFSDGRDALYSVGPYDVFKRSDDGWERLA